MSAENKRMEYSQDDHRNHVALQRQVRKRSDYANPKNTLACEILELADIILKCHDPKETSDPEDTVRIVRSRLSPA